MKRYRSHKVVEAAKIMGIDRPNDLVITDDNERHRLPLTGLRAEPGWYLVRYADGYLSCSPPKAFEEGYAEIDADGIPLPADTKEALAMALGAHRYFQKYEPHRLNDNSATPPEKLYGAGL
ncbi:hypothetical protein [Methylobacterium sp. 285MFTsu5.1]|uniref:hypothetical protein n=1 Tax=Methylobacterium sp. 285MFTsu5.1 TaxID=1172187 RepID=UPI000365C609|nr:hypothetical protein [Methylobacterium sp. 285MFTsu5.1]